jgi:hypothetical protein
MLSHPISHELLYFLVPAEKVNEIATWIIQSDEAYLQDELNKHGVATVIRYQGKFGFQRIVELPKIAGTAIPYYGTTGGAHHFIFNVQEDETTLRVRHALGKRLKLKPYETTLGTHPQFERQAEASNHWFTNRSETLIENREKEFRFYIDGEIYANLLAIGWQKERIHEYQYKFIPTSVGCHIIIRNIASAQTFDLTEDIEW